MAATLRAWFNTRPLMAPDRPCPSRPMDVVAVAQSRDGTAELRITRRVGNTYGFHFMAWANFADAGGGAHHLWHEFHPEHALVTDSFDTAVNVAFDDARVRGLELTALERTNA